jgi:SnoaL-like domain
MGSNEAVIERYREVVKGNDIAETGRFMMDVAADDFVQEWPQSGERIVGTQGMLRLMERYQQSTGTSPKLAIRSIKAEGDLVVVEGTMDYGDGIPVSYVGIAEFGDGKVHRMTEYFANPFPAPDWRADVVERFDPVAV